MWQVSHEPSTMPQASTWLCRVPGNALLTSLRAPLHHCGCQSCEGMNAHHTGKAGCRGRRACLRWAGHIRLSQSRSGLVLPDSSPRGSAEVASDPSPGPPLRPLILSGLCKALGFFQCPTPVNSATYRQSDLLGGPGIRGS